MADKSNEKFWEALEDFIDKAKKSKVDPITTDMVVTYHIESGEVTAVRVGGAQEDDDGTGGGSTSYPP